VVTSTANPLGPGGESGARQSWSLAVRVLKFAAMAAILLWVIAYRLHLDSGGIPDFVYVNF